MMKIKVNIKCEQFKLLENTDRNRAMNKVFKVFSDLLKDREIQKILVNTDDSPDCLLEVPNNKNFMVNDLLHLKNVYPNGFSFEYHYKDYSIAFFETGIYGSLEVSDDEIDNIVNSLVKFITDKNFIKVIAIDIQENYKYKLDHLLGEIHRNMGRYAQWFHIFTPKIYQGIISKEALLNTPAYKVEDLGNDIIFIQTHKDPYLLEKDQDAYIQLMKNISNYLLEHYLDLNTGSKIEPVELSVISEPKPEPTIYDKSDWHIGDLPEGLSQEQGYVPTSLYLMWLAENDLYAESLQGKMKEQAQKVKEGKESVTSFYEMLGGYFTSEELNEEGLELTNSYFDLDGGSYHMDYEMELKIGDQYATIYHVPATLDSYETLKPRLDRRLHNFREYGLASLGW